MAGLLPSTEDLIFIGVGAVGAYLIAQKIPSLVNSMDGSNKYMGIDNIPGIDLTSLNICRQKGLM